MTVPFPKVGYVGFQEGSGETYLDLRKNANFEKPCIVMYLHPHGDSHDLDGSVECKTVKYCVLFFVWSPLSRNHEKKDPSDQAARSHGQAGFVECHHGFVAGILVITMQIFWNRIHASIDKKPAVIGGYFHHWGRWVSPNFSQDCDGFMQSSSHV